MRKASKILYLVAGIVGIVGAVLCLIFGLVSLIGGIAATNGEVAQSAGVAPNQQSAVIAAGISMGIFLLVAAVCSLLAAIFGFRGRSNSVSNKATLIVGIIGTVACGVGTILLVGAILGLVADKQGQPA